MSDGVYVCDDGDNACIYAYTFLVVVVAIVFLSFAYYRPLIGTKSGEKKQVESVLLALFITPIFTMFYGYQNPVSEGSEILTAVAALFFPFIVFCIPYKFDKVTQSGGWV